MADDEPGHDDSREGSAILPNFIDRSFLAKFLASILLVLLLVGVAGAYTYVQTSDELSQQSDKLSDQVSDDLSEQAETRYTGISEQSALQIENWQDARRDTTARLANLGDLEGGNASLAQVRINEEMDRLPDDVIRLHYVKRTPVGNNITASNNDGQIGEGLSTTEAPWLTGGIDYGEDGVFVSEPVIALQQSSVYFVSPVETSGSGDYILVMQTSFDKLAADLGTDEQNQFTQVVNSEGRIVAGTERELTDLSAGTSEYPLYAGEDPPEYITRGLNGSSGFVESSAQRGDLDEEYIAAFAPVEGQNLVVVTHDPSSQAFALRSTVTNTFESTVTDTLQSTVTESLLILIAVVVLGLGVLAITFGRGTVNALNRLTGKANELESGNLDVDLSSERADEFGSLTASFAAMRDSLRERIEEAEQARKEAEVSRAEALELNNYLQEKADEYAEIMQQCAAGDITQRLDTDGESEAMDRIASEFNEMIGELEKTTGQLKSFSQEVETAGEDVQQSADVVRQTSEQAADAAMGVAEKTDEQIEQLEAIAETIDDITADLEQFAQSNEDVDFGDSLDRIQEVSTLIDEAISHTDEVIAESENAAAAAEEQAAELNEVSERAGDLVRYAGPLQEVLGRFETESEHEFYFPTGPGSGEADMHGED